MNILRLRTLVAVTVVLLLLSAPLFAAVLPGKGGPKGPVRETSARPGPAYKVYDVGNLWTAISNFGNYGEPNDNLPSGEWPGGSSINYIWEGRFWVSALIGGEPLCSHADYGNYELDPTEGSFYYFGAGPKSIKDGWVRFDDMTDYSGHTPIGFEMSQRALTWSIPEYDDFFVIYMEVKNVSGGSLNGAFVTWVFDNDCGAGEGGDPDQPHIDDLVDYDGWARSASGSEENMFTQDWVDPMDLDNDGDTGYDAWGWERANPFNPYVNGYEDANIPDSFDPEPDGVWDEYQIFPVEGGPVIYGQPGTDFEGQALINQATGDTLKGYLLSRNMSYMYDGDFPQSGENDTGERMLTNPVDGFIGTRMLYIPQDPFYVTEDDTMPRPYSHQWWNWESDPGSDPEKYEYMTGTHSLSAGMKFMPHPFRYGAGAPVFDYRYMISCGPFNNWADGETKKFVMVTGVGKGIQGLRENVDNAMLAYYQGPNTPEEDPDNYIGDPVLPASANQLGFTGASNEAVASDKHFLLPIPPPIPDLHYSAADRAVELVWDKSAETTIDNFIGAVDFEGYKVYRSLYNAQNMEIVAAFDNRDDAVLLTDTEGDMVNPIVVNGEIITYFEDGYQDAIAAGNYDTLLVNLPDIEHTFTDRGGDFMAKDAAGNDVLLFQNIAEPVNGLKYYYTVVAYDPDKTATFGLKSIESAKSNYRKTLAGAPDPVVPRPDAIVMSDGSGSGTPRKASDVKVVPNPYEGTALFESRYEDRLAFFFLPPECKITIFTMTGDMVDEIYHEDATTGAEYWDMISRNNQKVVSGLYIYTVETPDGDKHIGKFLIKR